MAAGRPTVATAVDGIPEILTDGRTGLLYPHEDDAALAERIARLARDPDGAAAMGAAARQEAESRYGNERFIDDVLALYRRLAPRAPGGRR
jgi:glycosyltransferase involved in cell wall biosynthesis